VTAFVPIGVRCGGRSASRSWGEGLVGPPLTENDREFELGNNPLTLSRNDSDRNVRPI